MSPKANGITGGKLLYLDWTLVPGSTTTHDVASGAQDSYIKRFARGRCGNARGATLVARPPAASSTGVGGRTSSRPRANPTLTTADFVAARRRVVAVCKAEGATNVSWAWIANACPTEAVSWVDSRPVGLLPRRRRRRLRRAQTFTSDLPLADLDGAYEFAVARAKPFFLARMGRAPRWQRARRARTTSTWTRSVFDYVTTHAAIKASAYFEDTQARQDASTAGHVFLDGGAVN